MGCPLPRRCVGLAAIATALSTAASGQVQLPESAIPDLVSGLVYVSLSQEISAANYTVSHDGAEADDTTFQTLKVPWERDFDVASELGTLYVEAALGWLTGQDRYSLPLVQGQATVSQDWNVYGGLAGAGWTFPVAEGWRLRPSVSLALSRIENDARYNELGQQVLAPLLDGVYVN